MLYTVITLGTLCAFAWLSIRHFRAALPFFFALLPTYLIRFSLGPLPTTFLEVCFWILFGTWIFQKKSFRSCFVDFSTHKVLLVTFVLLSFFGLAVVPREHLFSSLGLWRAFFFEPLLLGWMLGDVLRDPTLRMRTFLSLAYSGFVLAVLGVVQYVTRFGIPAPWDIERRITSVFDYPNALGLFLAPLLSALLVFGFSTWKYRLSHERIFILGTSLVLFLGLVLAQTEAALVAVPAALFIASLISPLTSQKQKIAITLLATLMLLGSFAVAPVREKLLLQDFSGQVRLSQWKETIALLQDHPFAGAGIGYYPELLRSYHRDWQYEIFQYPHTLLLNVWVELGLLGVGGGVLGILYLAKKTWGRRDDALILAASTALLTMLIHGLVDVPFFKNDLAMMTVLFVVVVITDRTDGGTDGTDDERMGRMVTPSPFYPFLLKTEAGCLGKHCARLRNASQTPGRRPNRTFPRNEPSRRPPC